MLALKKKYYWKEKMPPFAYFQDATLTYTVQATKERILTKFKIMPNLSTINKGRTITIILKILMFAISAINPVTR